MGMVLKICFVSPPMHVNPKVCTEYATVSKPLVSNEDNCKENAVETKPGNSVGLSGVGDKAVCLNFTVNITKWGLKVTIVNTVVYKEFDATNT